MNIVLINPYITVSDPNVYLTEPLGLVCLASYIKQVFDKSVNISILDLYALGALAPKQKNDYYILGIDDEEYIKSQIIKFSPDLIGISCNFTIYSMDSLELANLIKKISSNIPIVIGGAHASIEAEAILRNNPSIDFVIRSEGEITLEFLINALQGLKKIELIEGLTYRTTNRTIISNPPRELINNLDILPIPDRSFIDMELYKRCNKKSVWYIRQEPVASIMTSRGCPYNCVFCSTKVVWQRKWRPRNLDNVFKEIELLFMKYNIKEIIINDDQFFTQKKRVIDFCNYFINRNLNLSFAIDAGVSVWLVDEETLKLMRKAGFYSLRFPIESGNDNTIKFIKKPVDLKKTKDLIIKANKLGFWTSANFIIGFPYETREEINETINYAYSSTLDYASFLIAKPNAGSELYDIFKKEGLLEKNVVRASHFFRSDYDTKTMKAKELNSIIKIAARRWYVHKLLFYINPKNFFCYLLPKFKSLQDLSYFIKVILAIFDTKIKPNIKLRSY